VNGCQIGIARHEAANALVGVFHGTALLWCAGVAELIARTDAIFQSPEAGKLRAAVTRSALATRRRLARLTAYIGVGSWPNVRKYADPTSLGAQEAKGREEPL